MCYILFGRQLELQVLSRVHDDANSTCSRCCESKGVEVLRVVLPHYVRVTVSCWYGCCLLLEKSHVMGCTNMSVALSWASSCFLTICRLSTFSSNGPNPTGQDGGKWHAWCSPRFWTSCVSCASSRCWSCRGAYRLSIDSCTQCADGCVGRCTLYHLLICFFTTLVVKWA